MRIGIIVVFTCLLLNLNAGPASARIAEPPPKKMCGEWEPVYATPWTFQRQVPFQEGFDQFNAAEAAIGSEVTLTVHETGRNNQSWHGWRLDWSFEGTARTDTGMTGVYYGAKLRVYDGSYDVAGKFAYVAHIDWANGYKDQYMLPLSQDTTARAARRNPQYVVLAGTYGPDSDMGLVPDLIRGILNPYTFSSLRIPFHCVQDVDESTLNVTQSKDSGRIADIPKIDTVTSAVGELKASQATSALPTDQQRSATEFPQQKNATSSRISRVDPAASPAPGDKNRLPADTSLRAANSIGHISTGGFAGPAYSRWMTGAFDTDFGLLTLTTEGGSYTHNNGRVTVSQRLGPVMEGIWQESSGTRPCSDGSYHGRFRFEFTESGFTGAYAYCDDSAMAGSWNGKRKT